MPRHKGPGSMALPGCNLQQSQWKQALKKERWEDYWGSGNLNKGHTLPTHATNEALVCSVSGSLQSAYAKQILQPVQQ